MRHVTKVNGARSHNAHVRQRAKEIEASAASFHSSPVRCNASLYCERANTRVLTYWGRVVSVTEITIGCPARTRRIESRYSAPRKPISAAVCPSCWTIS